MVNLAWSHEDLHLSYGIGAARRPENDLRAGWERMVGRTEAELRHEVVWERGTVGSRIWDTMLSSHQHQGIPFSIWFYWADQRRFLLSTVTVFN